MIVTEKKPTKYYSSLQENRIADYLGWSAVSASGARHFNPGDIKAAEWLAECKTHTKEIDNITIDKKVWKKIATEAKGCFRKPVLFVDNGTQEISNTWAIVPKRLFIGRNLVEVKPEYNETTNKITFKHSKFSKKFADKYSYCSILVEKESLYIVKMVTFKSIFLESE